MTVRYATLLERQAECLYDAVGRALGLPIRFAFNLPNCAMDPHDHGDEDDIHVPNFIRGDVAPSLLDKKTLRHWASIGFRGARTGGVVMFWPARRLPSDPDHDGGDEQPRFVRKHMDGI